ncbi:MAG: hypothetical protein K2X68_12935 [Novosphingobium sp.]|nr:hypothetical protein [Novosphingobium sp.]
MAQMVALKKLSRAVRFPIKTQFIMSQYISFRLTASRIALFDLGRCGQEGGIATINWPLAKPEMRTDLPDSGFATVASSWIAPVHDVTSSESAVRSPCQNGSNWTVKRSAGSGQRLGKAAIPQPGSKLAALDPA